MPKEMPDWINEAVKSAERPPSSEPPHFIPTSKDGCFRWALFAIWVIGTIILFELRRRSGQ